MTQPSSPIRFFRFLMIAMYAVSGILVIFLAPSDVLPLFNRLGLGCSLVLYSIFRLWKFYAHTPDDSAEEPTT